MVQEEQAGWCRESERRTPEIIEHNASVASVPVTVFALLQMQPGQETLLSYGKRIGPQHLNCFSFSLIKHSTPCFSKHQGTQHRGQGRGPRVLFLPETEQMPLFAMSLAAPHRIGAQERRADAAGTRLDSANGTFQGSFSVSSIIYVSYPWQKHNIIMGNERSPGLWYLSLTCKWWHTLN